MSSDTVAIHKSCHLMRGGDEFLGPKDCHVLYGHNERSALPPLFFLAQEAREDPKLGPGTLEVENL